MTQECKKCGVLKQLTDFYEHSGMRNGHLSICKECKKKRTRELSRSEHGRAYDKERRKTTKRRQWLRKYQVKMRSKFAEKYRTRNYLANAIRDGRMKKGDTCEVCGTKNEVEAHHDDYTKPLEVKWLCRVHHRERHNQFKRK